MDAAAPPVTARSPFPDDPTCPLTPPQWYERGRAWRTPDGNVFLWRRWPEFLPPGKAPRFVVGAVHGLGGRSLDWMPLGHRVAEMGGALYTYELRTQGMDAHPGSAGDLRAVDQLPRDAAHFLHLLAQRHPGRPLFFAGESMGGIIAINTLKPGGPPVPELRGLLLFVPVTMIEVKVAPWLRALLRALLKVIGGLRVKPEAVAKRASLQRVVTRDEAYQQFLWHNPHKVRTFTLRFWQHLGDMVDACEPAAPHLRLPTLMQYAGQDVFIKPDDAERFANALGDPAKEVYFYPEACHLLLHDPVTPVVLQRSQDWLEARLREQP